jgi:protein disulfide isomerase
MSEDIPASNDGPVKVVVGEEFDKIVKDPTKDVLIMFYAPWCGHCKKLKPVWEELGKEFEGKEDIVIAKFDATLNEVDGLHIKSYPTLKFYPKDNKAGVDVKTGRTLPDLKKYLEENASSLKTVQHDEL